MEPDARNPLPVAQPNYRNLTFKDGNTCYSGSPYLGYKGTLPTGTVSQNICGEWYFPWHSHALNEFANFDEALRRHGHPAAGRPARRLLRLPDLDDHRRRRAQERHRRRARRRRHDATTR